MMSSLDPQMLEWPFTIVRSEQTCNQIAKYVVQRSHTSVFLWKLPQSRLGLTFIHLSIISPSLKTHLFIQNFQLPKTDLSTGNTFFEVDLRTKWLFICEY